MSGIGKGVVTSSLGKILQSRGFRVTASKIDPYINVDSGTMNPIEHGEIFVTEDGVECDQDIGNYERFLSENLFKENYMTTGSVYLEVIKKERNLKYKGKCVEVIPHIPDEVISRIRKAGKKNKADFIIVEIGGTVGEYQNLVFLEAARMMRLKSPKGVFFVLVTYLPIPSTIGEMKTKPTQNAVRALNEAGIQPDLIVGRSSHPLDELRKEKISVFCNISPENVISAPDVDLIYEIPINFEKENLSGKILKKFKMRPKKKDMEDWEKMVNKIRESKEEVKIGIMGKYFETGKFILPDSYISVIEAIKHAAWFFKKKPVISWLLAEEYEKNPSRLKELKNFDGIIIPGGFGNRGVEGKIKAIQFCREKKIPFFGLCLGMQLAVIEFARNVCRLKGAHSTEMDPRTEHPVIDFLPNQKNITKEGKYGGTMRLGAYDCRIKPNTITAQAYKKTQISERHRHRYELNNEYGELLQKKGMIMAGNNPKKGLVEIIEVPNHPFFLGTQFHPEFKSSPTRPHPLFKKFIKTCINK